MLHSTPSHCTYVLNCPPDLSSFHKKANKQVYGNIGLFARLPPPAPVPKNMTGTLLGAGSSVALALALPVVPVGTVVVGESLLLSRSVLSLNMLTAPLPLQVISGALPVVYGNTVVSS
jgi:hypothetical protein